MRVVFDCAATYQGMSLNKSLLQGPDMTNTLLGVLLRFRQDDIAIMADIESMFYQVKVPKADCDFYALFGGLMEILIKFQSALECWFICLEQSPLHLAQTWPYVRL